MAKKKLSESQVSKFISLFNNDDNVAIFTHPTPDPDAVSSALGVQWMLKKSLDIHSSIFYGGDISHPQNKSMVNYLEIHPIRIDDYNPEEYSKVVIVDSTERGFDFASTDAVIDHHRIPSEAGYIHIEPVGATATLIWEYIKDLNLEFTEEADYNLAIALYMGITTDTQGLLSENTTDRDNDASWQLLKQCDRKKLDNILNYELPSYFYELRDMSSISTNNKIKDTCWVSSVGIIPPAKRDVLPMLSDDMIKREGILIAVVIAIVGEWLEASVRSKNATLDVNAFCQKIFGKEYGGGKLGKGGARVPLGLCNLNGLSEELKIEYFEAFRNKMFHQILSIATGN